MVLVPDEQQLSALVGDALRAHDSSLASLLRMLKNSLHNAAISNGLPLDVQSRTAIYRKEVKQRRESAEIYLANNRLDSAKTELSEAEYIETLLPKLATHKQITESANRILLTLGVSGQSAKGALIKQIKSEYGSNADGKMIADVVSQVLQ